MEYGSEITEQVPREGKIRIPWINMAQRSSIILVQLSGP